MLFHEVISVLYSRNINRICELLNKSVYAKDWPVANGSLFIHTGFFVKVRNTGNLHEFLYDVKKGGLVRQPFMANDKVRAQSLIASGEMDMSMGIVYEYNNRYDGHLFAATKGFPSDGITISKTYYCQTLNEDSSDIMGFFQFESTLEINPYMFIIFQNKKYKIQRNRGTHMVTLSMNKDFVFKV